MSMAAHPSCERILSLSVSLSFSLSRSLSLSLSCLPRPYLSLFLSLAASRQARGGIFPFICNIQPLCYLATWHGSFSCPFSVSPPFCEPVCVCVCVCVCVF